MKGAADEVRRPLFFVSVLLLAVDVGGRPVRP